MNARKTLAAVLFLGLVLTVGATEASAQTRPSTTPKYTYQFNQPTSIYPQYQHPLRGNPITVPTFQSNPNVYQNARGQTIVTNQFAPPPTGSGWQKLTPVRR